MSLAPTGERDGVIGSRLSHFPTEESAGGVAVKERSTSSGRAARAPHPNLLPVGGSAPFAVLSPPDRVADRTADDASHECCTRRIHGWLLGCRHLLLGWRRLLGCRRLVLRPRGSRRRCSNRRQPLCEQCVMLQFVEIPASRIVPCR